MSALLTDRNPLTMLDACLGEGMDGPVVFELVVRKLRRKRNFLGAAGLEQMLEYVEGVRFDDDDLAQHRGALRHGRGAGPDRL